MIPTTFNPNSSLSSKKEVVDVVTPVIVKKQNTSNNISKALNEFSFYLRKNSSPTQIENSYDSSAQLKNKRINATFIKIQQVTFPILMNFVILAFESCFQIWDLSKLTSSTLVVSEDYELEFVSYVTVCYNTKTEEMFYLTSSLYKDKNRKECSKIRLKSINKESNKSNEITIEKNVYEIQTNKTTICLATHDSIIVLDYDLNKLWEITDIELNPKTKSPVFSVGERFIAYSTSSLSAGSYDISPSDSEKELLSNTTPQMDRITKDLFTGLKSIGDYGMNTLSGYLKKNEPVSIVDYQNMNMTKKENNTNNTTNTGKMAIRDLKNPESIYAEVKCHYHKISKIVFDNTGNLVATSSVEGHSFYVYEMFKTKYKSKKYRLLYKLVRGYTDAIIVDMCFNVDSRWLTVTSSNGTTHLYAINPYGNVPSIKSLTTSKVFNAPSSAYTIFTKNEQKPTSLNSVVKLKNNSETNNMGSNSNKYIIYSAKIVHITNQNKQFLSSRAQKKLNKNDEFIFVFNSDLKLFVYQLKITTPKEDLFERKELDYQDINFKASKILYYDFNNNNFSPRKVGINTNLNESQKTKPSNKQENWLAYLETKTCDCYISKNRPLWTLNNVIFESIDQNNTPKPIKFRQHRDCNSRTIQKTKSNQSEMSTSIQKDVFCAMEIKEIPQEKPISQKSLLDDEVDYCVNEPPKISASMPEKSTSLLMEKMVHQKLNQIDNGPYINNVDNKSDELANNSNISSESNNSQDSIDNNMHKSLSNNSDLGLGGIFE